MTASALSSGTYTARTEQSDAAGNVGYSQLTTFAISGVADVTAPVVSLNAPPASSTDTTPTLAGSAGILPGDSATVTVRVFSGTSVAGAQVQALSATRTSGGSYTIDSPALAAGTYTARAEQSDSAGNTGFSPSRTFAIAAGGDNTPPVVSLTSPDPGSSSADDTPLFSGLTGGAAGDLDTITVRVYAGSTVAGNPVRSIQTSRLSGNWFIVEATSMSGGTYTARSEQSDTAGNTGYSTPLTFTITGSTGGGGGGTGGGGGSVPGTQGCTLYGPYFAPSAHPAACWKPYAASSPFNRPVPANPRVQPNSAAIINRLRSWGQPQNLVANQSTSRR